MNVAFKVHIAVFTKRWDVTPCILKMGRYVAPRSMLACNGIHCVVLQNVQFVVTTVLSYLKTN
jgi:hypothetical protein